MWSHKAFQLRSQNLRKRAQKMNKKTAHLERRSKRDLYVNDQLIDFSYILKVWEFRRQRTKQKPRFIEKWRTLQGHLFHYLSPAPVQNPKSDLCLNLWLPLVVACSPCPGDNQPQVLQHGQAQFWLQDSFVFHLPQNEAFALISGLGWNSESSTWVREGPAFSPRLPEMSFSWKIQVSFSSSGHPKKPEWISLWSLARLSPKGTILDIFVSLHPCSSLAKIYLKVLISKTLI